uniref:Uncharacterized protein n=1 Tax=Marmota marmota marmota TaxID=9994 RepID=A0A8C5Z4E3_MARMA
LEGTHDFLPLHPLQVSCSCHTCIILHNLIWRYGLSLCWQYFCQYAKDIGFIKLAKWTSLNGLPRTAT